ncbi:phosphatase PAP2 family protein [Bradyrhizobium sp. McL0615]|uniref:phosphatase PAP2 family protein n=1 Tax=Bradyrhizobium sp. McL0615 TaxID=3415673 RepID=UPI003CEE6017
MVILSELDTKLLLAINSFFLSTNQKSYFMLFMGNNPVPRGFPIFFALVGLWFSAECNKRRGRMLIGLLATCFATVTSVWLQRHFTPHIRPFLDPTLPLKAADFPTTGWDRLGSFPSDTATLFFSLVAVIFIESRLVGLLCFAWAFMTAGIARIALGIHFPSDILGALVLGPAAVCLFDSVPYLQTLVVRVLNSFQDRMYLVHSLLFLFLAEAYDLFAGFQGVLKYFRIVGG